MSRWIFNEGFSKCMPLGVEGWRGGGGVSLVHQLQAKALGGSFNTFLSAKRIFLLEVSGGRGGWGRGDPTSPKRHLEAPASQPRPWPNHLLKRGEAKCHKDRRRPGLLLFFLRGEQTEINGCSGFPPRHIYGPAKAQKATQRRPALTHMNCSRGL